MTASLHVARDQRIVHATRAAIRVARRQQGPHARRQPTERDLEVDDLDVEDHRRLEPQLALQRERVLAADDLERVEHQLAVRQPAARAHDDHAVHLVRAAVDQHRDQLGAADRLRPQLDLRPAQAIGCQPQREIELELRQRQILARRDRVDTPAGEVHTLEAHDPRRRRFVCRGRAQLERAQQRHAVLLIEELHRRVGDLHVRQVNRRIEEPERLEVRGQAFDVDDELALGIVRAKAHELRIERQEPVELVELDAPAERVVQDAQHDPLHEVLAGRRLQECEGQQQQHDDDADGPEQRLDDHPQRPEPLLLRSRRCLAGAARRGARTRLALGIGSHQKACPSEKWISVARRSPSRKPTSKRIGPTGRS